MIQGEWVEQPGSEVIGSLIMYRPQMVSRKEHITFCQGLDKKYRDILMFSVHIIPVMVQWKWI